MNDSTIQYYPIDYKADEKGFVSTPHSHRHYEIFYFEKGEATHCIDFEEYPITDHSFFLVSYNQIHYITAKPNTHNVGHAISIDKEIIDVLDHELMSLFGKFSQSPAFYLLHSPLHKDALFTAIFKQIQKERQEYKPKSTEIAFHFLKIVLTYIWRESQHIQPNRSKKDSLYLKYLQLLENNYTRVKSVQDYAKLLSVTTTQLNRVCKEVAHQTALAVIHERINLEAKRKLFYSENQVKDICYELGFEDAGHFNNFFKKMNNKTPMAFRAEMSQIFN